MIYYQIATQKYQSTEWEWKSTPVNSLEAVFQLGRQYGFMSADQLRVFAASAIEYLDALLVRENLGLPSNSLTLEQLLQDQQSITPPHIRHFEMGLGWLESAEEAQPVSTLDLESTAEEAQPVSTLDLESTTAAEAELERVPVAALERAIDTDFELDPEPWGGDHDEPYTFTFPEFTPHALAWVKLRARVQAGELVS